MKRLKEKMIEVNDKEQKSMGSQCSDFDWKNTDKAGFISPLKENGNDEHRAIKNKIVDEPYFVFVKFEINEETFASKFKSTSTVQNLKDSLADVLELEKELLCLQRNETEVEPYLTLQSLGEGLQPFYRITFQLTSSRGDEGKFKIMAKIKENIPTLDVITVHLNEGMFTRNIVVEIENQSCQKEWLGGFRNKLTGVEYHNAASLSAPKQRDAFLHTDSGDLIPLLYHRDTQTPFRLKKVSVDTNANKATQMAKSDLFIQSKTDKIITSRSYIDFETLNNESNIIKTVIKIQRAVRSWIRKKKFFEIVSMHKTIMDDIKKQKLQILKEQAEKERGIITSSAYPVKRDDFYMLYLMVGKWWKREWKRICELKSDESIKSEAVLLLQKEVELLENIEKHRISVKKEALKKERMRFLEQTSRPLVFKNKRGHMTSIDNLETQRAREFKEIYSALICKTNDPKERIDFLLTLKELFVSHNLTFEYANDIILLIEQEIDLLTIGIKQTNLKGLDKRLEQLYMNFLEQSKFNPKAGKYKKPNFPKTIKDLFLCTRCLKMLPASKFPVHVRMNSYTECKSCVWLKNIGHQRVDMSPYLKLLKQVQNSEMEKCCHSAVCFILQPIGMGYLTNIIWHGHSAISECKDLSKLQHVRWLPDVEWAPWNTILLTDQEAKCHASIPNVFEFYDKTFIENVRQKHIVARKQFIQLLKMDHEIRSSGAWAKITDSGPFLHPSHANELAASNEYDQI